MVIDNIKKLVLHFDPRVDSDVEIKEKVLAAYEKNRSFFDYTLTKECAVKMIYKREEMDKACGGYKTESWLVGTTTPEGEIYIYLAQKFSRKFQVTLPLISTLY